MSIIQGIEPPTSGRVILYTTKGQLEIELFCKEVPIACRNFLARCAEGYYDQTVFHKLIKGYIIQGGKGWRDEENTGGKNNNNKGTIIPDESHSRLKFNKRGILGTANEKGTKAGSGSGAQFLITLSPQGAPELDRNRHNTVFGKLTPKSLYTLTEMSSDVVMANEGDGDGNGTEDMPLYPVKVTGTEIAEPYFDDVLPTKTGSALGKNANHGGKGKESGEEIKKVSLIKKRKIVQKVKLSLSNQYEDEDGEGEEGASGSVGVKKFQIKVPIIVPKKKKMKKEKDEDKQDTKTVEPIPNLSPKNQPSEQNTQQPNPKPGSREETEFKGQEKVPEEKQHQPENAFRDAYAESFAVSKHNNNGSKQGDQQKSVQELEKEFEELKSQFKNKKQKSESSSSNKNGNKGQSNKRDRYNDDEGSDGKDDDDDDIMNMDMSKYMTKKTRMNPKGSENRELETMRMLNRFNSKIKTKKQDTTKPGTGERDEDEESDRAASDLSEEEDQDPYDLYFHKFGTSSSSSQKQSHSHSQSDSKKHHQDQEKTFAGTKLSSKDAALIAQDDKSNRGAQKYSWADPERRLGSRNTAGGQSKSENRKRW